MNKNKFTARSGIRSATMMLIMVLLISSIVPTLVLAADSTVYSQSFNTGSIPTGWTNANPNFPWRFDDPDGMGNLCGGTGLFATADISGLLTLNIGSKATLTSPSISLSGANNAYLQFKSAEYSDGITVGRAHAYVYISVDGGAGQLIWDGSNFNAKTVIVQVPSSALGHNVQFYFVYVQPLLGLLQTSYWQVDDFMVYSVSASGDVQLSQSAYSGDETAGSVAVTVTRTAGSSGAASVDYATSNGTALAGVNYNATHGTLNFANGQTSATITIPIRDDGPDNGNKAFSITLSNPAGGLFLGSPTTATITVNDVPDGNRPGIFQFDVDTYNVYTTTPSVTLTIDRVDGSVGAASVECRIIAWSAKAGINYVDVTGDVNFANGQRSNTFTIPLLNDGVGNKMFQVWLMNPTNGTNIGYPVIGTVNIGGANPYGTFKFSSGYYGAFENSGSVNVTVTRDAGSMGIVTVQYATSDGTAQAGVNYNSMNGILSFANGQVSQNITIPVLSDGAGNGDKYFPITLSNPTGGADLSANPMAIVTVKDINSTSGGVISLSGSTYSAYETDPGVLITVTRGPNTNGTVAVDYATSDGTAVAGTNYAATSGTLTFVDGQISANVTVPMKDDGPGNSDKSFHFTISNVTGGAALGSPNTAIVTVSDVSVQDRGVFQFSSTDYSVLESASNVTITIDRTGGSKGAASIDCKFINATAKAGVNFQAPNATVNFSNGETNKSVTINIMSDGPNNLDKYFQVWLMNPTNVSNIGYPVVATVTVLDDPNQAGDFQFSTNNYTVDETSPYVNVTVTRSAGSNATALDYATSDGTAVAGTNYAATNGTLTFGAGEPSKNITIPVKDDGPNNGDKSFTVTLSNPVNGTIGTPQATVTVKDVPPSDRGTFQFDATDYSVLETNSTVTLIVERPNGSKGPASVDCKFFNATALNGVNYQAANTTLNFVDGEASKTLTVAIKNDGPDNGNKTFQVWLMNPTNYTTIGFPAVATVTVLDDSSRFNEFGKLSFSPVAYVIGETGGYVTLDVVRNEGSNGTVTVDYGTVNGTAKAGVNYVATSGTLSFAPGETSQTFNVSVIDDGVATDDLAFTAVLSNVTGGAGIGDQVATVTVTDKEIPTNWSLFQFSPSAYSVNETGGSINVTVTRNVTTAGIVSVDYYTVNGTAVDGVNYASTSGTLTFGDNESSKTFTIPIRDDGANNGDKQFQVRLARPTNGSNLGYPSVATVTVNDVDKSHRFMSYTINLYRGWNMISFPVVNDSLWASTLNGTGISSVSAYNRSDNRFTAYLINVSPSIYDINMQTDNGYYLYCDYNTTLTVYGSLPDNRTICICPRWNLIGWSTLLTSDAKNMTACIPCNQSITRYSNAGNVFNAYLECISPDIYNFNMMPGEGYWVYSDSTDVQTYTYET